MAPREESSTLVTIDEALAAGRVTAAEPKERELQTLALAVRDESPVPADEFARRMDERVATGFGSERSGRPASAPARAGLAGRLRRPPLPALAGAASLLAAIAVAASFYGGDSDSTTTTDTDPALPAVSDDAGGDSEAGGALEDVAPAEAPAARSAGAGAVTSDDLGLSYQSRSREALPGRDNRRVDRSAQVTLAAPADELQEVGAGIASVADRHRGVLMSSSLTTGEAGRGGGSFELDVPVDELPSTLAELSDLATVRSLTQAGDDRTARFVRRGDDVDELRADLVELQADLAAAATDEEFEAIRAEVRRTRDEISAAERAFESVRDRTAFATIAITLVEGEERQTGLGAALHDGVDLLENVLAITIRALGVALPLGLLAAVAWWIAGVLRRRQRESALA